MRTRFAVLAILIGGFTASTATVQIPLQPGWNLVSFPVDVSAQSVSSIFGDTISGTIWGWGDGHLIEVDRLQPGEACWVYRIPALGQAAVNATGSEVTQAYRPLNAGWNLIGPLGDPPVADLHWPLQSRPGAVVVAGPWRHSESGLSFPASLAAGEGAWIYTTQDARVRLSGHPIMGPVLGSSPGFGQLALQWAPASDDRSSTISYSIQGNGASLGSTTATSFGQSGFAPGGTVLVSIGAEDGEGKVSADDPTLPVSIQSVAPNIVGTVKDLAALDLAVHNLTAEGASFTVIGPDADQVAIGDMVLVDSNLRVVIDRNGGDRTTRPAAIGEVLRDGRILGSVAISANDLGRHTLASGIHFDGELDFSPVLHFDALMSNGLLSNWNSRLTGDLAITGTLSVNLRGNSVIASEQVLHSASQTFQMEVGNLTIPLRADLEWVALVSGTNSAGHLDAEIAMTAALDASISYDNGFGFESHASNTTSMPRPDWTLLKGGNLDLRIAIAPRVRLTLLGDEVAHFSYRPTFDLETVYEKRSRAMGFSELDLLVNSDYLVASDIGVLRSGTTPWVAPVAVASTRLLGDPVLTLPTAEFANAPDSLYLTEPQNFDITVTNGVGNVVQPDDISWSVSGDGPLPSIVLSNNNRRATVTAPELGSFTLTVTINGSGLPGAMGARVLTAPFVATHIPYRFVGATRIDNTTVDIQFSEPAHPDFIGDFDLAGTPIIRKELLDDGSRVRLHTHYLYNHADEVTITSAFNTGGRPLVEPTTRPITPTSLSPLFRTEFDGGVNGGWTRVDDPLATSDAPSNWFWEDGALKQNSLIRGGSIERYDLHKPGAYYLYPGDLGDSLIEARMASASSWGMGLIARYQAADQYYRFEWSGGDENPNLPQIDGIRRIVKVTPEGSVALAQDRVAYFHSVAYDIRFLAIGERLSVIVDGELVLQAADAEFATGRVGIYSWGNQGLAVDSVTIDTPSQPLSFTSETAEQRPTAPIMQHGTLLGELTSTSAIAWARSSEAADIRLRYGTSPDLVGATLTPLHRSDALRDYCVHIAIDGLTPGSTYYARTEMLDIARPDQINYSPIREFRTPAASGPMDFSMLLICDVAVGDPQRYRAFDSLIAEDADYMISLGDFPYADHVPIANTTPEFQVKHGLPRSIANMRELLHHVPTWGMWDDHEVTNDWDGEKSRQLVGNGLEAWHAWWPLRRDPTYKRPALERLDTSQAFRFDGVDSMLRIADPPDFGQQVTVSFWFKWRSRSGEGPFFRGVGPSTNWLGMFQDRNGKFRCKVYTSATDYTFFSGGGWDDNDWHHALLRVDADAQRATLYLDGIKSTSKAIAGELRQPSDFIEFGSSSGGPDALIDEIIIYDRTDLEPWQFVNEEGTPRTPPAGMRLWWRGENVTFPQVDDQSGNALHGIASGVEAETFVEDSSHVIGRAPQAVPNYRKVSFGDSAEFFLLDTRFYRDRNHAVDDGTKTMLGETQLAWLLEGLSNSTARFKVIVSTVAMRYGTTPNDYWAGFTRERDIIFDYITQNNIKVFFLSGDQHWHAVYEHPEGFVEVQTSSITAGTRPPQVPLDHVDFLAQIHGYTRLDIYGSDDPRIEVHIKDAAGNVGYTRVIR